MTSLLRELEWRGFVQEATPGLAAHLERRSAEGKPVTVYCGFDPTASSLQLGNLLPLMLLRHLQHAGHRPIVLMGGGTGLIGDPSGRRAERPLLAKDELRANLERQRAQMERFLDFSGGRALLMDNADWLVPETLVDFLREVGKHFTVNIMLQKESVKARLEAGLSFTEFSYMLLQAYDFLQLYRRTGCTLQVGGSDQWGNITAGVELIRRVENAEAHALVAPLITTASGVKFGKSESGAIYLDPKMTSPYRFYQFWVNTDDRDAERYLKLFTERPKSGADGVDALMRAHAQAPAKRVAQHALAADVTKTVHGDAATESAVAAGAVLFDDRDPREVGQRVFEMLTAEIPTALIPSGAALVDAVTTSGLTKSKSEARRQIEQGGIYVNRERRSDPNSTLRDADWLAGGFALLRKGKKEWALLRRR
ncbi:MAG TPA: tyrosine--tRNA ligase [Gemmatimonadales bacterium]|nr:tyrosine--tRNA ligase [Gemmatimonadales bacterium]